MDQMDQKPGAPLPKRNDPLDDVQEQMRSQDDQGDVERKERLEYLRRIAGPRKAKRDWRKWAALVLIILALAGAVSYWFLLKADTGQKKEQTSTPATQNTAPESGQSNATITTKHHQSSTFMLEFDYPDDWTITEEGGILTAKSPSMQLKGASGKAASGQIVVTIQGKQAELKEFKSGNGIAVRESEKLTYAKPTASQRAQTYLSFVAYAGSAGTGIEGLYITGDIGYQKDQAVPMVDIVRVDPLITVSFTGNGAASLSVSPDNWKDSNLFTKSIKTVLTSLSIQ